jgi:formylglycine-generating enzyme required for sulfatase activity
MGSTWPQIDKVIERFPGISKQWLEDEVPQHVVSLNDYYIDKFEVTTAQYREFIAHHNKPAPKFWEAVDLQVHATRPVAGVTWFDADAYCRAYGKRLPTEAEWEKAARGADGREFPWGDDSPTAKHANFDHCCEWKGYGSYSPVGSYEPGKSPYGVYDLAGNVWEWVADWYDLQYYSSTPAANPPGPHKEGKKVQRGGSWNYPARELRAAWRGRDPPTEQDRDVGFRCAQDAKKAHDVRVSSSIPQTVTTAP